MTITQNNLRLKNLLGFSSITLLLLSIVLVACRRESIVTDEARPAYVSPTLLSINDHDLINDHKRYIALGVAELVNNSALADLPNSINNIHNYLDGFTSLDIALIKNTVHFTNSAYLVPSAGTGNEFGDAINYAINFSGTEYGM